MAVGTASGLRARNRDMVLRQIAFGTSVSRKQISEQTGLTGAAVSRITRELIEAGLVQESGSLKTKGQVGRRNIQLELGGDGAFVLGIALTANVRSVSISNCRGDIIARRKVANLNMKNPNEAVRQLATAAGRLIKSTNFDASRLVGCGVSVAGLADPATGDLIQAAPLGWDKFPLGADFSDRLGLPVHVEGRPIALLMAEHCGGAAAGLKNVMLVSNGIWVGGAMMLDGTMLRGQNNMVGQIPHLAVQGNKTLCTCGRKGCLNAVASGAAILSKLEHIRIPGDLRHGEPGDRLQALTNLPGPWSSEIRKVFKNAGRKMGFSIDQILSIIDPELVLLAGAAGRQADYIDGVRETLGNIRAGNDFCPILASKVTSDQSAAWLALNAFVYSHSLNIGQLRAA